MSVPAVAAKAAGGARASSAARSAAAKKAPASKAPAASGAAGSAPRAGESSPRADLADALREGAGQAKSAASKPLRSASVQDGAGVVLGALVWVWVVLPYLNGGWSGVRAVLAAKFTNSTGGSGGAKTQQQNVQSATLAGYSTNGKLQALELQP